MTRPPLMPFTGAYDSTQLPAASRGPAVSGDADPRPGVVLRDAEAPTRLGNEPRRRDRPTARMGGGPRADRGLPLRPQRSVREAPPVGDRSPDPGVVALSRRGPGSAHRGALAPSESCRRGGPRGS